MEEFNFGEFLRYLKRKLGIFIVVLLLVFVSGAVYSLFFKTPLYESSTSIILSSDEKNKITQNDIALNKSLSSTYTEIVKSHQVIDKTITDLNLNYNYSDLVRNIQASTVSDTVIIKITASSSEPALSQKIANSVAQNFINEISEIYKITNISILDEAAAQSTPNNINYLKDFLTYFAAGLITSTGLILVMYYLHDNSKAISKKTTKDSLKPIKSTR